MVTAMSNDKTGNNESSRSRRSSLVPMPLNSIYPRTTYPPFPSPTTTTAAGYDHHRGMSISSLGLYSLSVSRASSYSYDRRSSISSTCSMAVDDNVIDEEDGSRIMPTRPYFRRLSLGAQAIRNFKGGGIAGENSGFNLSEHFRSRAESSVSQNRRPSFSSPHISDRLVTIPYSRTDVNGPQSIVSPVAPVPPHLKEPDAFQERLLKGDFYID